MKAFPKKMSRRSQVHDWFNDFWPYFGAWCAFLTLIVTIFFAAGGQKSNGGLIAFIVGSSCLSLIWLIVSVILISGKRRQIQKDSINENLQLLNRRREQITANQQIAEISESAKNTDQAITTIASSGLKIEGDQFNAFKQIGNGLISIIDQDKNELCEKISKMGDRVNNLTFEMIKLKGQKDLDSTSILSEGSKSI